MSRLRAWLGAAETARAADTLIRAFGIALVVAYLLTGDERFVNAAWLVVVVRWLA